MNGVIGIILKAFYLCTCFQNLNIHLQFACVLKVSNVGIVISLEFSKSLGEG
jgi:hypothetical protein